MRRFLVGASGVLVLLSTGCGSTSASPATPAPVVAALSQPCKATDEPPQDSVNTNDTDRLPARFVPTAAYLCYDHQRSYPGNGIWQVLIGQRLDGDLAPLRTALAKKDTPAPAPTAGVTYACAASLEITPTLILVGAGGEELRPRAPVDSCGDQLPDLENAISGLRSVNVQVLKLRQLQTQAQVNTAAKATALGCETSWKDRFTHGMLPSALSRGGRFVHAPASLVVCLYRANPVDPLDAGFVSGGHLDATQTQQLLTAATRPGEPGGCGTAHTAVLVATHGPTITAEIEIGGCSRVIRSSAGRDTIGRVDPAAVEALTPR